MSFDPAFLDIPAVSRALADHSEPGSLWVDGIGCLARRPFFVGTPTHPGTPITDVTSTHTSDGAACTPQKILDRRMRPMIDAWIPKRLQRF